LKVIRTYIACLDDHRNFSEDIRKRFSDTSKYTVSVTHNREDLVKSLGQEKGPDIFRIAILGLHDSKDNFEYTENIAADIKAHDRNTAILVLASPDKLDDIRESLGNLVSSCIPRNANSVLRIHNTVKKLVSEHNLTYHRNRRNISARILIAFLILCALLILVARFLLPGYF
jgi:DNA-binding NarL/FixJ family response regulator